MIITRTRTGILLVAALLVAVAESDEERQTRRSRHHLDYVIWDGSTFPSILGALTDLDVTDEMSVEEIGEKIIAASVRSHPHRHIYLSLADLTNTSSTGCLPETVSICLSIMGRNQLQTFWKFIEARKERFHRCAKDNEIKIMNHIRKNARMHRIVKSLECFIRKAMDAPAELQGHDYVEKLKMFHLSSSKLKTRQLLMAIEKSKFYFSNSRIGFPPVSRVERYLDDRCMPFQFVLRSWLDSINLDILLGNYEINDEIDKISEYHRICIEWANQRSRISRNLWKGFLF